MQAPLRSSPCPSLAPLQRWGTWSAQLALCEVAQPCSEPTHTQPAMQAPPSRASTPAPRQQQQEAPPAKRRRLVKAADIATEQVLQQLQKEEPASVPKASREAAIVLDSDDEAAGQRSGSDDDEGAPLRLDMHADLSRGARHA